MKRFSIDRVLFILSVLLLPMGVAGQTFPQYWVMDRNVGLVFSIDTAMAFLSKCDFYKPTINYSSENISCASVDSLRYFYCNGDSIFNWEGDLLINGDRDSANLASSNSVMNGCMLLPTNSDKQKLLWLSNSGWWPIWSTGGAFGLSYSVVDVSEDAPNGRVVSDKMNQRLLVGKTSERIMAIRHVNGVDWWVIAQNYPSGDLVTFKSENEELIYVSEYTDPRLEMSSTVQALGEWDYDTKTGILYYVDFQSCIYSLQFDNCTGEISFIEKNLLPESEFTQLSGFSLSNSGSYCYVSGTDENQSIYRLLQVSIFPPGFVQGYQEILVNDTTPGWPFNVTGQLQRGPDESVYFACTPVNFPLTDSVNLGTIGRIQYPDLPYPACNVQWDYLSDTNWVVKVGLPNLPVDVPWAGITAGTVSTSQDSGCYPLTVSFSHNSCGQLGQVWDFGDGSGPDSSETPSHTYMQPGLYALTLTLWHKDTSAVVTYPVTIYADDCVAAGFQADTTDGCYTLGVRFSSQHTGNAQWAVWEFGDGTVSDTLPADSVVEHLYASPGSYTVALTVGNAFSSDRVEQTGYITVQDCGDFFQVYPNPSDGHVTVEYHQGGAFHGELWDLWGRKLTEMDFEAGYHKLPVDWSRLATAVYFLRVELPGGEVKVFKFGVL